MTLLQQSLFVLHLLSQKTSLSQTIAGFSLPHSVPHTHAPSSITCICFVAFKP